MTRVRPTLSPSPRIPYCVQLLTGCVARWCIVIYPVDFKENGHIVDDVRLSSPSARTTLLIAGLVNRKCTTSWSAHSPLGVV